MACNKCNNGVKDWIIRLGPVPGYIPHILQGGPRGKENYLYTETYVHSLVNVSLCGERMNPVAPMTFSVLKYVLEHPETAQRMVARDTGVSLGQVNKVFFWLSENSFIERNNKSQTAKGMQKRNTARYRLVNPTGILRTISLFRSMKNNQMLELNLNIKKEEALKYLKKKKVLLCLDSALERYHSYFRGDTICVYVDQPNILENVKKELSKIQYGITKIRLYRWDFAGLDILDSMNSTDYYTTEIQTVIDLFCDNKAHYTKELLKRRWGIEL